MVGRQLIVSPIFQSKGKLSTSMLRNLHIRGAGTIISDTLQRFGRGSTDPVAATVVTLEPDTGAIRGLRYETRGAGPEITFRACELWPAVSEDVTLKIKLRDLSILSWVKEGEKRNQTEWLDLTKLKWRSFTMNTATSERKNSWNIMLEDSACSSPSSL